jgi:LacI family transcriptional regulator
VSHVLNDSRPVSDALRNRVQVAMKQLSYQPDVVARSLRRRETLTIGLCVPSLEIPFYAWMTDSVEAAAHAAGYNIILCSAGWSLSRELAAIDELVARRVDGMVCISIAARPEHIRPVLRRGTPVVWLERMMPGIELDAVFVNNFKGAYDATRHLIELGHRRIGCIMGMVDSQLSDERVAGHRQALADVGLPFEADLLQRGDYMPPSGRAGAEALLARSDPPTAIFAFNDLMAMGALQAINRLGRRIPDDVAVIGFDGVPLTEHTSPPLSTIEQPIPMISKQVIALLLDRINGDAPWQGRTVITEPKLIARASTLGYPSDTPAS